MGITSSTTVQNNDHTLQVHRETQTDNENITFIFAPSFVPCDIFREILKTSLPKENKKYK